MWYRNNFHCCDFTVLSGGLTCTLLQLPAPLQPKVKGFCRTQWKCSLQQEELLQRAFLLHQWHTQHLTATRLPLKPQWLINDDFYLSLILHNNAPTSFQLFWGFVFVFFPFNHSVIEGNVGQRHHEVTHVECANHWRHQLQKRFDDGNYRRHLRRGLYRFGWPLRISVFLLCLFYCNNSKGTNLNLMKCSINLKSGKMPA